MKKKTSKNAFIIMLLFVVVLGYLLSGGPLSHKYVPQAANTQYILVTETPYPSHETLQLKTLHFITATPIPSIPSLCQQGGANDEPEILAGYLPANGQSVSAGGQIKVWINDEGAPIIGPDAHLSSTGQVTSVGNPPAKSPDGYLWEPALYIAPQTAETGGMPHFPTMIKGDYNNNTSKGSGNKIPGMDPVPGNPKLAEQYTAEDIWDVNSLGLTPGSYTAEFVIHDGDDNRGVGCVSITIL